MASDKIAIFPASGKLGGSLMKHGLKLIPPSQFILISRFPSKLEQYHDGGAALRAADYDKPETLENVFSGVKTLFLISYASFEHEHRSKAHRLAIDNARKCGVSHIFYSSLAYAGNGSSSVAHVMQAHLDTERYLSEIASADPTFSWTAIREALYSESFPIYTAFFNLKNPSSEIRIPHDGNAPGIAWAKIDELGEASARLLASHHTAPDTFEYRNRFILLSGPREWTLKETAAALGRVVGKEVSIVEVSMEEYVTQPLVEQLLTVKGTKMAKQWKTAFDAVSKGEASVVTHHLAEILEREPEDFESTIRAMVQ